MPIYEDNTKSIGRTPLVRINRLDASERARRFSPRSKAAIPLTR